MYELSRGVANPVDELTSLQVNGNASNVLSDVWFESGDVLSDGSACSSGAAATAVEETARIEARIAIAIFLTVRAPQLSRVLSPLQP